MPSNRHNLILDEQAFQGLLSAAFIVQEYNDRLINHRPSNGRANHDRLDDDRLDNNRLNGEQLKSARPHRAEPEVPVASESASACRHCGAPKQIGVSLCESCGREEFRPGERLQRNWASMWLMSQNQELWPVRSAETRETTGEDDPPLAVGRPFPNSAPDTASFGLVAQPSAREISGSGKTETLNDPSNGGSAQDKAPTDNSALGKFALEEPEIEESRFEARRFDEPRFEERRFAQPRLNLALDQASATPAYDTQAVEGAEAKNESTAAAFDEATDEANRHLTQEEFAPEESDLAEHTFQLSASDDVSAIEPCADEPAEPDSDVRGSSDPGNRSLIQHLADLRVILRFHRSNLYLAGAIFLAAIALLWPTGAAPRRAALGPWERALITLGLAEAPEPAIHVQGDPGVEVWVDPHTALYYCPGEEQYGKTADGRLSSQRDAQMDRFEPAGRSACE